MRYPNAPSFAARRRYRIVANQGHSFQVQYRTWLTRRWKGCSNYYSSVDMARYLLEKIKHGLPDWETVYEEPEDKLWRKQSHQ